MKVKSIFKTHSTFRSYKFHKRTTSEEKHFKRILKACNVSKFSKNTPKLRHNSSVKEFSLLLNDLKPLISTININIQWTVKQLCRTKRYENCCTLYLLNLPEKDA